MAGEILKSIVRLRDEADKFTKAQAYYVDDAYFKTYRCGNCMHYTGDGACSLVSGEGNPGPGQINPQGACVLYNARAPRVQWIQHLWGRDDLDGLAPEIVRATAFTMVYASLGEIPPDEIREKSAISLNEVPDAITNSSSNGNNPNENSSKYE